MTDESCRIIEDEGSEFIDGDASSSVFDDTAEFTVPAGMKKLRLDAFLGSATDLSRSRIKRLVEQGGRFSLYGCRFQG